MMDYFGLTNVGRVRDHNEDAWKVAFLTAGRPYVIVSDGLGGQAAGEIASRIVVETLPLLLESCLPLDTDIDLQKTAMRDCLAELSRNVAAQSQADPVTRGMAATVVCGVLAGDTLVLGHMGDSRCYLFRERRMRRLTRDHTVAQLLLDTGEITEEQTFRHPASARLIRAVGMDESSQPEVDAVYLQSGDRLLFCSDGLHGMIRDEKIASLLASSCAPEFAGIKLVDAALDAGGRDNITVVVADLVLDQAPP